MDRRSFLCTAVGFATVGASPNVNQCCGLPPMASKGNTHIILASSQFGPHELSSDVRLIFIAQNYGRKTVAIAPWTAPHAFDLSITDLHGSVVLPDRKPSFPEPGAAYMAEDLKPGEVVTFYAQYGDGKHDEDSSLFPLDDWGYDLEVPGSYLITATFEPHFVAIVSNMIRVDLVGPRPSP